MYVRGTCVRVYVCGGWGCASEPLGAGQVGCVARTQCQQQDLRPCPCIHALWEGSKHGHPQRGTSIVKDQAATFTSPGGRASRWLMAGVGKDGGGPPMFQARRGGGGEQKVFVQGPRGWQPGQGHDLGSGHYQRGPAPLRGKQHIRDLKPPSSAETSLISRSARGRISSKLTENISAGKRPLLDALPSVREKIVIKMAFISTDSGLASLICVP